MTVAYSARIKTLPLLDLFTLTSLYTVRVLAGGYASGHHASEWLLVFSGFLFLALAVMKRVAELRARQEDGGSVKRRPYQFDDLRFLEMFGLGASLTSALVLALYAQAGQLSSPSASIRLLWSVPPLMLFWQARLWLSTFRGYMMEDPLTYAMKDWVTRLTAVVLAAFFIVSGL